MSDGKIESTFDAWAESGRDAGMEEGHGDVVRQVVEAMGIRPGERILDLGCGNGWATRLLARSAPGVQAVGIDCAPKMIARADELHSFTIRARYDHGSFEALPYEDASFDRLFSMEALYYARDLDRALAECLRVLEPGGAADVVVDFYEENAASRDWPERMGLAMHRLSTAGWKERFEAAGFADVRLDRLRDRRGPGEQHGFAPDERCVDDWGDHVALHEAGSLWIHATRPGEGTP